MMSARIILLVCVFVCHRATATSQPKAKSQPTCRYNNKNYKAGQIPTNDPCLTCWCPPEGGKAQCKQERCDGCSDYEDPVYTPGKCCPKCEPRTTTPVPTPYPDCEYDGHTFKVNTTTQIDCTSFFCNPYGELAIAVTCCFFYDNKTYEVGPIPQNDPCTTCECLDNFEIDCASSSCWGCGDDYEIVYTPGTCCPDCRPREPTTTPHTPDCDYNGQPYGVGPIPTNDPCLECECLDNGETECASHSCEACDYDEDAVHTPGKCCPDCQPREPPAKCEYNGQPYEKGPIPTNDPCLECQCLDEGRTECASYGCAGCDYHYDEVYTPGKCCPDCRPREPTPESDNSGQISEP